MAIIVARERSRNSCSSQRVLCAHLFSTFPRVLGHCGHSMGITSPLLKLSKKHPKIGAGSSVLQDLPVPSLPSPSPRLPLACSAPAAGPPRCSPQTPAAALPQGLCAGRALSLECPFPTGRMARSSTSRHFLCPPYPESFSPPLSGAFFPP